MWGAFLGWLPQVEGEEVGAMAAAAEEEEEEEEEVGVVVEEEALRCRSCRQVRK